MRGFALIPLALLVTACWSPGPGEMDPTRYPWDQPDRFAAPAPAPRPAPPPAPAAQQAVAVAPGEEEATYCVVALEPTAKSGIIIGGGAPVEMGCGISPNQVDAAPVSPR